MVEASKRGGADWFGFERGTEKIGSSAAEITTAPVTAWSSEHRRRLLQTPTAKGLVPVMGIERVDDEFRAFSPPAPGTALSEAGAAGRRTKWREQAALVEGAARATHEGHLLGLEHGALSEASIHVSDRDLAVSGMGLTRGATLPGEPSVVAPEVIAGAAPTPRSDVYSLGKLLERGFEADRAAVPLALGELVASATAEDPARRPASALAFADGIRETGGASLPTYALAALGGGAAARALGSALSARAGAASVEATPRGTSVAAGVVGGAAAAAAGAGALSGAAAASTGASGARTSMGATGAASSTSSKKGAALAGAALVGIAGLGLWAATDNDNDREPDTATGTVITTEQDVSTSGEVPTESTAPGDASQTTAGETETTAAPETTAPATTAAPETTLAPETTAPATTAAPETTAPATTARATTVAESTVSSETGSVSTTEAPTTSEIAAPPAPSLERAVAAQSYEILHAIPGVSADAYLDGELAAADFGDGMVAGPIAIDQGLGMLTMFSAIDSPPADLADRTDEPLIETSLDGTAPGTLVVYLDGDTPTVAAFENDLGNTPPGQARVAIQQFSPEVASVSIDGEPVVIDSSLAADVSLELPAGPHTIVLQDADGTVLVEETIDLADGQLASLFVRPGADGAGAALSVRSVTGLASAPVGIPSGTGGLLGEERPEGLVAAFSMMVVLGSAGVLLQRRRARRLS